MVVIRKWDRRPGISGMRSMASGGMIDEIARLSAWISVPDVATDFGRLVSAAVPLSLGLLSDAIWR